MCLLCVGLSLLKLLPFLCIRVSPCNACHCNDRLMPIHLLLFVQVLLVTFTCYHYHWPSVVDVLLHTHSHLCILSGPHTPRYRPTQLDSHLWSWINTLKRNTWLPCPDRQPTGTVYSLQTNKNINIFIYTWCLCAHGAVLLYCCLTVLS